MLSHPIDHRHPTHANFRKEDSALQLPRTIDGEIKNGCLANFLYLDIKLFRELDCPVEKLKCDPVCSFRRRPSNFHSQIVVTFAQLQQAWNPTSGFINAKINRVVITLMRASRTLRSNPEILAVRRQLKYDSSGECTIQSIPRSLCKLLNLQTGNCQKPSAGK